MATTFLAPNRITTATRSALSCSRLLALIAVVTTISLLPAPLFAQFPGGFLEKSFSTAVRPRLTAAQTASFLPATRGKFTFPAPYNTEGIRLTDASDCSGTDCVRYVGYSYWRNINNHVGSDTMYVFLGLREAYGGPTLFSYNKATDEVSKVGPLFPAGSSWRAASEEGWYFSGIQPTKLYVWRCCETVLYRYDVLAKTSETVLDISSQPALYGTNRYIWQMHSSDDDRVHIGTVRDGASYAMLGCFVYEEDIQRYAYYPTTGGLDECNLDKSGRWLIMLENDNNRIVDLQTNTSTVILDPAGALGHLDMGDGYAVGADNWNLLANATILLKFPVTSITRPVGPVVHYNPDWSTAKSNHVSHQNRKSGVPPEQQYACGSNLDGVPTRENEIVCYRLDTSYDELVVAPVMTDVNASGGGDSYSKMPKGNLDVTGKYFIWTSNMAGTRLDAFIVKVPAQLLTDTTPPTVSIVAPTSGSTVAGTITVLASAADNVGVVGVQFKLDGTNLGVEVTTPPYSILWNTTTVADGLHTLTAVARDAAGNLTTSSGVSVTVANLDTTPPVISSVAASLISSSGAAITWVTNEASDSQVEYGLTTAYGSSTTLSASLVTSHSQTLSGLAANTLYHYRVKSRDAAGNLATSADFTFTTPPPPDTTPPVIAAVTASSITASSAAITWATDEAADTQVEYGTTTAYGASTMLDLTLVTSHSQTLSSLAPSTLYHYRVKSKDAAGNLAVSGDFTFTTAASGTSVENVIWTSLVNVTATGNSLQKTSGCDGCADAGATSQQQITSGNGYVEFTASETAKLRYAGLSNGNPGTSGAEIKFAIRLQSGIAEVRESGVYRADTTFVAGDVFRVGVESGVVKYYKNGTRFYTSTVAPTYPLLVDTSISNLNGTITNAVFSGASSLQNVIWTSLVNVTATGNSLQKTSGCDGCADAGATSQQQITSGNGYVEFTASETAKLRYAGLSNGNPGTSGAEIKFAIRLQSGIAEVRESGVYRADTTFVAGDVFRVGVESGVVKYYKNGTRFYTSTVAPTYPLLVDTSISNLNGTITNAVFSGVGGM